MKSGIFVIASLSGAAAERILEIQRQYDPRMAREWPPHVTLAGSSGMGPIAGDTPLEELRRALEPIAAETPAMSLPFGAPIRFMQSNVVVLPLDPHGPLRALHERIKTSGLRYDYPRHYFTPHCTLSFYPELPAGRARELLRVRVTEPAEVDAIEAWHTFQNRSAKKLLHLPLTGVPEGVERC